MDDRCDSKRASALSVSTASTVLSGRVSLSPSRGRDPSGSPKNSTVLLRFLGRVSEDDERRGITAVESKLRRLVTRGVTVNGGRMNIVVKVWSPRGDFGLGFFRRAACCASSACIKQSTALRRREQVDSQSRLHYLLCLMYSSGNDESPLCHRISHSATSALYHYTRRSCEYFALHVTPESSLALQHQFVFFKPCSRHRFTRSIIRLGSGNWSWPFELQRALKLFKSRKPLMLISAIATTPLLLLEGPRKQGDPQVKYDIIIVIIIIIII